VWLSIVVALLATALLSAIIGFLYRRARSADKVALHDGPG
jgi:uncharacterized membrane protein AbrB (regulator of aidB expression)